MKCNKCNSTNLFPIVKREREGSFLYYIFWGKFWYSITGKGFNKTYLVCLNCGKELDYINK